MTLHSTSKPKTPRPSLHAAATLETDDELLAKSLTHCSLIPPMQERGATDDELLVAIRERWRLAPCYTKRPYRVDVKGLNTTIYFGREADGVTSLSVADGTLLPAVRRVLGIAEIPGRQPDFQELKAKGKSRPKGDVPVPSPPSSGERARVRGPNEDSQPQAAEESTPHPSPLPSKARGEGTKPKTETLAAVVIQRGISIPLKLIDDSPWQARGEPSAAEIEELAESLRALGQLTPIRLRRVGERYQLIAGHRRTRAARAAGWETIVAAVVDCADVTAAIEVYEENDRHKPLNDIERAKALHALETEHRLSRQQLADLTGLKKDSLSNIIRLLELPDAWQRRVISGEIAGSAARALVPWADEPAVLARVAQDLRSVEADGRGAALPESLWRALHQCSTPIKDSHYYDPKTHQQVNLDVKSTDELRVKKVGTELRAFNVPLAEKLIAEQVQTKLAAKAKAARKGPAQSGGLVDPAVDRKNAQKQREQLAKRLYRFKVGWLQAACLSDLADPTFDRETLLALLVWLTTRDGQHRRVESLEGEPGGVSPRTHAAKKHAAGDLFAKLLHTDGAALWPQIQAMIRDQVAGKFDGYHNVFDPSHLETLATVLDIQLKRDWPTSFAEGCPCEHLWDQFVGLWSREQLIDLLAEWKLTPKGVDVTKAKRGELAACLLATKPCPQSILEAKPVPLT